MVSHSSMYSSRSRILAFGGKRFGCRYGSRMLIYRWPLRFCARCCSSRQCAATTPAGGSERDGGGTETFSAVANWCFVIRALLKKGDQFQGRGWLCAALWPWSQPLLKASLSIRSSSSKVGSMAALRQAWMSSRASLIVTFIPRALSLFTGAVAKLCRLMSCLASPP